MTGQHRSGDDPAAPASRIGTYRLSASEKRIDFVKGTKDILDKGRVVRLLVGPESPRRRLVRLADVQRAYQPVPHAGHEAQVLVTVVRQVAVMYGTQGAMAPAGLFCILRTKAR